MSRTAAAVVILLLGVASTAGAQAKPAVPAQPAPPTPARPNRPVQPVRPAQPFDRFYVSVNGAFQAGGGDFGETVTFRENAEDGTFTTDYNVESGPAFNISVGGALTRQFAIGVGVTRYSKNTPTALSASVPHPFFFNRPRSVEGDVAGISREELAVHIQARAMFTPRPQIQGVVYGGPSFFKVKQDIVNDFEISEAYPYDTAAFSRGLTTSADESKLGFHVGADVGYFFTRQVGVGGSVQWSRATIDVPGSGGTGSFEVNAGGLQAGGGLRLRF